MENKKKGVSIYVNENLWKNFQITCKVLNINQPDVLEDMLTSFIIKNKGEVNEKIFKI
jgi:hypothetical protein